MGLTDEEGTAVAILACGLLFLLLLFYGLRDAGALPWQREVAAWLASW